MDNPWVSAFPCGVGIVVMHLPCVQIPHSACGLSGQRVQPR